MWKGELGWRGELGRRWGRGGTPRNCARPQTRMYEVLVLSTLLCNVETWTVKERQKQRLRVFEMACHRGSHEKRQDKKRRRDRIRNEEIFNRLNNLSDLE